MYMFLNEFQILTKVIAKIVVILKCKIMNKDFSRSVYRELDYWSDLSIKIIILAINLK
jgi:hypothetical protein